VPEQPLYPLWPMLALTPSALRSATAVAASPPVPVPLNTWTVSAESATAEAVTEAAGRRAGREAPGPGRRGWGTHGFCVAQSWNVIQRRAALAEPGRHRRIDTGEQLTMDSTSGPIPSPTAGSGDRAPRGRRAAMTVYQYIPHPHIASRRAQRPVRVADQMPQGNAVTRFNTRVAILITQAVGSMWCAYAFALFDLISLPEAIRGGAASIVSWVAQTFLQLVLLSVIMVGQNVQAAASDKRSEATFHDASATLYEVAHLQAHLAAQDELLTRMTRIAAKLGLDPVPVIDSTVPADEPAEPSGGQTPVRAETSTFSSTPRASGTRTAAE
jgi:hypothetical protein